MNSNSVTNYKNPLNLNHNPTNISLFNCHNMFLGEFVLLELERTVATVDADRITEIGLISVKDGEYQEEWQTLINPQKKIPFNIQMITGINDQMVENQCVTQTLRKSIENLSKTNRVESRQI